ncbi:DMT family transporter [Parapusillimonas granuli]|uniref:DMT family transporter n=1 Tax=Parapusillimonas granuli TaxID=380911 RepID=A0A853G6M8_9BURK|nr:DMT family transporter [Parapusillimonas granuli]MBB5217649.1 drug/metabolite transporter (DMT)-like permease [Parapusillimonas granuli]NYT51949.1 DMT family transporter [Parapusillimonas granuli]
MAILHPATQAATWMSGALVSLAAMAVATRELSALISISQILFFRSTCGLLIICFLLSRKNWRQIISPQLSSHVVRNTSHLLAQYAWIYGIMFIPMAEVFAIEFTAPVWSTLLAAIILKEKITYPRLVSLFLGVLGVLLIVRPGANGVHPAALVVLCGSVCFALSYTMTKKLSATDTPLCILFYMTAIQLPLALIPSIWNWQTVSYQAWPYILIVGTVSLAAHYCMARAMRVADVAIVVPLDFLRLPLIAVVGAILYGERVEVWVLAGAALILIGNLFSIRMEKRRQKQPTSQA